MNWFDKLKEREWKIDWILVGEIISICIILVPILLVSLHALPAADDFSNSNKVRTSMANGFSHMQAALDLTVHYYKYCSGYFFAVFLNFLISPLLRGGIGALRGVVFVLNLIFYVSLYYFVSNLLQIFFEVKSKKVELAAYLLVLFAFTNIDNNSQTWTWYCVLIAYIFVIASMFWGIIFFLKAMQSKKVIYIVAAAVIGFFVSGASLNVTALNCGIYLILGFLGFKIYNKKKIPIICFGSALLGGLINLAAPGNFIRHESVTDVYPIGGAAKAAALLTWTKFQQLFFYTPFIVLLLMFFVLAIKCFPKWNQIKGWHLILALGVIFLGVTIVNFPVCLGYNSAEMPDRCVWVEDCTIYIGIFSWAACLAGWVRSKTDGMEIRKDTLVCIAVSCMLFLCSLGRARGLGSYPTVQMAKQLMNGEIAEYDIFWESVLEEIETSPDRGVAVLRERIEENQFVYSPRILSDRTWWVNAAVALYYDKDWIYVSTEGEMDE